MSVVRVVLPKKYAPKYTYQTFRDLPRKGDCVVLQMGDSGDRLFVVETVVHYSQDLRNIQIQAPDVHVREQKSEKI